VKKCCRGGQTADDSVIQHMHILCWKTEATYTPSEYIIIMVFYCKDCYTKASHCYSCTYSAPCIVICVVVIVVLVFIMIDNIDVLSLSGQLSFYSVLHGEAMVSPPSTCLLGYSTLMLSTSVIYLTHFLLTLVTYHFTNSEHCKTRYLPLSVLVTGIFFSH